MRLACCVTCAVMWVLGMAGCRAQQRLVTHEIGGRKETVALSEGESGKQVLKLAAAGNVPCHLQHVAGRIHKLAEVKGDAAGALRVKGVERPCRALQAARVCVGGCRCWHASEQYMQPEANWRGRLDRHQRLGAMVMRAHSTVVQQQQHGTAALLCARWGQQLVQGSGSLTRQRQGNTVGSRTCRFSHDPTAAPLRRGVQKMSPCAPRTCATITHLQESAHGHEFR